MTNPTDTIQKAIAELRELKATKPVRGEYFRGPLIEVDPNRMTALLDAVELARDYLWLDGSALAETYLEKIAELLEVKK